MGTTLAALALAFAAGTAHAETLNGALARAYEFAPPLNAVRAAQRALDENVAIAKSGYRPNVNATADLTVTDRSSLLTERSRSAGVSINQRLFDGFQRQNAVRGAKAGVFAGQEDLRGTEQDILLAAVNAYVSVIRDQRVVGFRRQNIEFLREQLNAAQARFEVGEGTRTDVAQARAERAAAVAELETAQANLRASEALYVQVTGQRPSSLADPAPARKLVPGTLDSAIDIAFSLHPSIRSAQFTAEQSAFEVKRQEGEFLPKLDVTGSATTAEATRRNANAAALANAAANGLPGVRVGNDRTDTLQVRAQLTIPIYQGGRASAQVRQSKERLSQARIGVDVARTQVRAGVVQAYSRYQSSFAARASTEAQIAAARLALEGLIEERNVGQRTTLDVLLGRQALINAQLAEAQNEAILVASSYEVAAAIGKLTAERLGLHVAAYDPDEHYVAVKDKWYGLRTPDQR